MVENMFHSPLGIQFSKEQVVDEVIRWVTENPKDNFKVIIGTDSTQLADKTADFVTAIVVHRVGKGGRYFWRRADKGKFHTLRARIIQEVLLSLEVARDIIEQLQRDILSENWSFEIHADIGENGPTKNLIQEVVGMIRGNNFECKTKPGSFAASNVADRHA